MISWVGMIPGKHPKVGGCFEQPCIFSQIGQFSRGRVGANLRPNRVVMLAL